MEKAKAKTRTQLISREETDLIFFPFVYHCLNRINLLGGSWREKVGHMDKALEEEVLKTGLLKKYELAQKALNLKDYETHSSFWQSDVSIELKVAAQKMYARKKAKLARVRWFVGQMVVGGCALFLTLTFNDETLANTNQLTRRRYVQRYLRKHCLVYLANIDFGEKNEREHYHAVCVPLKASKIDLEPWHEYGAIKVQRVRSEKRDIRRVSKYTCKLTYHAVKKTTGETSRLIWGRFKDTGYKFEGDPDLEGVPAPNWLVDPFA